MVSFYRHKVSTYGAKSLVLSSVCLQCIMLLYDISLYHSEWQCRLEQVGAYLDVCHPGNRDSIVCFPTLFHIPIKLLLKWNLGVTMTLNAMTLFPITLSCPIVQNSPKRPYSKSRRNQMREKSITFLSRLSLSWLNYWNKMLHLEKSLERERERDGEVGERETLLGTWVPFRLGPSSHRKPLKAVNDPLPVPGWEAVSLLWLSESRTYSQVWGQSKIIKKNIYFWSLSMRTIQMLITKLCMSDCTRPGLAGPIWSCFQTS